MLASDPMTSDLYAIASKRVVPPLVSSSLSFFGLHLRFFALANTLLRLYILLNVARYCFRSERRLDDKVWDSLKDHAKFFITLLL